MKRATPYERWDHAADAWVIDFLDGGLPDLAALDAAAMGIDDSEQRAMALAGNAMRRAQAAVVVGGDWIAPMAAAYPFVAPFAVDEWRAALIVRPWTVVMLIATALIGVALLVGRLTGAWVRP